MAAVGDIRRARLVEAMAQEGLDAVLLFGNAWQNDYLRYAADFGLLEGEGFALVDRDGSALVFLDDPLEAERARIEAPGLVVQAVDDPVGAIAGLLARGGNRRIGLAPGRNMPHAIARLAAPEHTVDATGLLDALLMVKTEAELNAIRRAASLADEGYEVFRRAATAGRADYELIAETEAFFRANGVDDNFMIIGVGGREVRGMAPPMGKRLKAGDLVTTELTPCVDGYYVQICRTLTIGPATDSQQRAFDLYHRAMVAGIEAVRPGVTADQIARAENAHFRAAGLGDYVTSEYTRVRGHGLGLFPDTKPHILEGVQTVIENGMCLIVHPNTYHPEVGYMVLGDALIVGPEGAEVLTTTPRRLFQGGSTT